MHKNNIYWDSNMFKKECPGTYDYAISVFGWLGIQPNYYTLASAMQDEEELYCLTFDHNSTDISFVIEFYPTKGPNAGFHLESIVLVF